MLVLAPAASAQFGLTNLSAAPADNKAGANSDFAISLDVVDPAADLKDLVIHLPPGLVGNPLATPTCSETELEANACPAASDVGDISNNVTVTVLGLLPVDLTVNGQVFNVTPRAGEPARFGIVLSPLPFDVPPLTGVLFPPIILQSPAVLRPGDFGLDTVLTDLPNTTTVAGIPTEININAVDLNLAGLVGNPPQGFLRNPTSCGTHTVGFDAAAYNAETATGQTTFDTVDCAALPFAPGFSALLRPMGPDGLKPEVTTSITQTIEEAGLKRARVILPHDLGADNSVLNNQCSAADFDAGTCPEASIIGQAVAASPLQSQPLTGPVALLTPPSPGLPQVGLDLRGSLALKLKGSFVLTAQGTGVEFDGLPDIPISDFQLTFKGGNDGLVLAARQVCSQPPFEFSTDFLAHSGAATQGTTAAKVSGTCDGGSGGKKKPKATVTLAKLGSEKPKLKLKAKAGSKRLRQVKLKLPKKLSLASGKRFTKGAKAKAGGKRLRGKAFKHGKRKLSLRSGSGANTFTAKVGKGALAASRGVKPNARMKFKVKLTDTAGKTTKLNVRSK
jgi:hypothetical protein